jgi:hypothetical protein
MANSVTSSAPENKKALAGAFLLNIGGEGGIRLHLAGRPRASTRESSNPTRKLRSLLSDPENKKAPLRELFY